MASNYQQEDDGDGFSEAVAEVREAGMPWSQVSPSPTSPPPSTSTRAGTESSERGSSSWGREGEVRRRLLGCWNDHAAGTDKLHLEAEVDEGAIDATKRALAEAHDKRIVDKKALEATKRALAEARDKRIAANSRRT